MTTHILLEQTKMQGQLQALYQQVEEMPERVATQVHSMLEAEAITAKTVTADVLEATVRRVLQECAGQLTNSQSNHAAKDAPASASVHSPEFRCFTWGGGLRRVPEDFTLPGCNLRTAWCLYCCGNTELHYAPFKNLEPSDMSTDAKAKILNNFHAVMRIVEDHAAALPDWSFPSTVHDAQEAFTRVEEKLPIPSLTPSGRKRRVGEIFWSTVLNIIRTPNKQPATSGARKQKQKDSVEPTSISAPAAAMWSAKEVLLLCLCFQ